MEEITNIYAVYCKDENGITILKKAYKSRLDAYKYVISKIITLLNIIDTEFKSSENRILPVGAQVIFTLFHMKDGSYIEQYDYFKDNYKNFFRYVGKPAIMFFVSPLQLV